MAISQGVQRLQFALETNTRAPDATASQLARLTVAGIAARRHADDAAGSARLVLEALGLLDEPSGSA